MTAGTTEEMGYWAMSFGSFLFQKETGMKLLAATIVALLIRQIIMNRSLGWTKLRPRLPPGPRNLPVLGALLAAAKETNIIDWFYQLGGEFGKIFYFRLGSQHIIVVSSAEGAEEVLKTKDALLAHRPDKTFFKSGAKYIFGGENIITASFNKDQRALKKLITANFFCTTKLALSEHIRRREGAFLVEGIQKQIDAESTVNVYDNLLNMSINVICALIFGKRYSDILISEGDALKHFPEIIRGASLLIVKQNIGDFLPWLGWADIGGVVKEFKAYNKLAEKVFGQIIEEHREARRCSKNHTDEDFVDVLLTLQEQGKTTNKAIQGCILDMLLAGTDSNATTTEWALLELVKHPDCLAKLQKEIDNVVGKDRRVEVSDFRNLDYLQAVIHEAFRLHAPIPLLVPHFTFEETTLQGFYVPANTTVFINYKAIARDPVYWKDPEQFDPERFMISKKTNLTAGNDFNLFPFGSGRRMCPAAEMGHLMVQRNLSTLVHAFDWNPPHGKTQHDIDGTEETAGAVARPKATLLLAATARLAPGIYTS